MYSKSDYRKPVMFSGKSEIPNTVSTLIIVAKRLRISVNFEWL